METEGGVFYNSIDLIGAGSSRVPTGPLAGAPVFPLPRCARTVRHMPRPNANPGELGTTPTAGPDMWTGSRSDSPLIAVRRWFSPDHLAGGEFVSVSACAALPVRSVMAVPPSSSAADEGDLDSVAASSPW